MPEQYNNYYEPFIGGGAVLFELQPEHAWINDINTALVHTYRQIQGNPEDFLREVEKLDQEIKERTDDVTDFRQMGIDHLYVDESHYQNF
mgnify:CR=1 FL=1